MKTSANAKTTRFGFRDLTSDEHTKCGESESNELIEIDLTVLAQVAGGTGTPLVEPPRRIN
jgi:hypothetical protein